MGRWWLAVVVAVQVTAEGPSSRSFRVMPRRDCLLPHTCLFGRPSQIRSTGTFVPTLLFELSPAFQRAISSLTLT